MLHCEHELSLAEGKNNLRRQAMSESRSPKTPPALYRTAQCQLTGQLYKCANYRFLEDDFRSFEHFDVLKKAQWWL